MTDEDGNDQGTVLIRVKRIYTPGSLGRFILGDYISASAKEYRSWVTTKKGKLTTVDGSYHLCKGSQHECPAVSQNEVSVHIGQWRTWKEEELLTTAPDGYGREAKALIGQYFKKEELYKGEKGDHGLPWTPQRQGILRIGRPRDERKEPPARRDELNEGDESEEEKVRKVSRLEKQLKELKASLKAGREKDQAKKKGKDDRSKDRSKRTSRREKANPFEKGGLAAEERAESEPDWGRDDTPEKSNSGSSAEGSTSPEPKGSRGTKRRERSEKRSSKDQKKKKKARKAKSKEDEKGKRKERLQKDKGPFGVGEGRPESSLGTNLAQRAGKIVRHLTVRASLFAKPPRA